MTCSMMTGMRQLLFLLTMFPPLLSPSLSPTTLVTIVIGIEFTADKTILDFNKAAEKVGLDYTTAFVEFKNVL